MTENTSGADTSYEQALKSTGIVGGAQFLTILITVVKTKIVALLLGPAGVGVLGLLQGIVDMIRNATGTGHTFQRGQRRCGGECVARRTADRTDHGFSGGGSGVPCSAGRRSPSH